MAWNGDYKSIEKIVIVFILNLDVHFCLFGLTYSGMPGYDE